MLRTTITLLMLAVLCAGEDAPQRRELQSKLVTGQRFTGSNIIAYEVRTVIRQGLKEKHESEAVKRTERFVDEIRRAGHNGVLEIDRSYLKLFSSARDKKTGAKKVYRSPLQGRQVMVTERNRRRDVKLDGRGAVDPLVRRTVGIELDWRDVLPEDPVAPGDKWDVEAAALARRLSAYLNSGYRSSMRVRYEEDIERDGASIAKFYVDWTVEGMRDRHLFTKVSLAGDVYFDHGLRRVVEVDLTGNMVVRGALIGQGQPQIVKGEGPVTYKSTLKLSPIEAAPEEEPEEQPAEEQPVEKPAN